MTCLPKLPGSVHECRCQMVCRRNKRLLFCTSAVLFVLFIWSTLTNVFRVNVKPPRRLASVSRMVSSISRFENNKSSLLVWPNGESNHPYFLSPILQFPNDNFRQKSRYNLTGVENIFTQNKTEEKLIIIYNMPSWHTFETRYKDSLKNCRLQNCRLSGDHKLLPQADAVVFYVLSITDDKPPPKPANQMWIFFAHEAPWDFNRWNDRFNWTMTFRYDSDIVCPYFVLLPKPAADVRDFRAITERKTKPVMWLVSHCNARSKRDDYVKKLQQYISVDIYGGCGPHKCENSGPNSCNNLQQTTYKFYLAFENSLCRGYLTEKVFRSYSLDVIPVVRGGASYANLLPKGTYIDTADFSSPEKLADHLKYLDSNHTAYAEILRRKSQYGITDPKSTLDSSLCDICVKIHDLERFGNTYHDVNKWWNTDSCYSATDF
ncbi:alpha-(1,3)-fucosyltransferase C-like isoform X1 [Haliotis asinina]|uniref:alpha-(1,3)-fucosyltransferase C-like isoform X1 n=2 Tax=Haliotis asinina TaxID=109174 RepID=UPI003531B29E